MVQEIVLARRITLLCGAADISWDQFMAFKDHWHVRELSEVTRRSNLHSIMYTLASLKAGGEGYILQHFKQLCSVKADKIYGLLGIVQKRYGELLQLEPRYGRPSVDAIMQILQQVKTAFGSPFPFMMHAMENLDIDINGLP